MERKMVAKQPTKLAGEAAIASHAWKRMDRMTLMGLSLRKLMELVPIKDPALTFQAASLQAGRGSRDDRTEAAHNLPRDLLVNGRSFWEYASQLAANPRVKLQIFYSSAATMTVPKESNYLDSRWEGAGLAADWLVYLDGCARYTAGTGAGTLGAITDLAQRFRGVCKTRLGDVITSIRERDYFRRHEDEMTAVFEIYTSAIDRYDPGARLERMWQIYQLPQYS